MEDVHRFIAYAIPTGFGILVLLAIFTYVANRDTGNVFWGLLGALQAVLGVQAIAGVVLLLMGRIPASNGPSWLHYIYGLVFPGLVLGVAHVQAKKRSGAEVAIFGVAAFLCCFATIRALQTGLGID